MVVEPVPDSERYDDWFGFDPPRDKGERHAGRRIKPLGLVRDNEHWRPGGGFSDELENRQPDHEQIRCPRVSETKGGIEGSPLRGFQTAHSAQYRAKQVVESGKWQMRF